MNPQAGGRTDRVALLVLGMHRSGTSLTAGLLRQLGFAFGPQLMAATPDNPAGYFEDTAIVELHDRCLNQLGSGWADARPLPPQWLESAAAAQLTRDLSALLRRSYAGPPVFVVKDPRLCRLLPVWRRVLVERSVEPRCILVWRHPAQVAASLAARDGLDPDAAAVLWLRYLLEAERNSRGLRRTEIRQPELLHDPSGAMSRVLAELDLPLPTATASPRGALDAFVAPDLHRQRQDRLEDFSAPIRGWLEQACSQPSLTAATGLERQLEGYDRYAGASHAAIVSELRDRIATYERRRVSSIVRAALRRLVGPGSAHKPLS